MSYQLFYLRDATSSNPLRLLSILQRRSHAVSNWGIFPGLFGLATNEAYWVIQSESPICPIEPEDQVELLDQVTLTPTVRPKEYLERSRAGVYVFRWFEVSQSKVDEVVSLSGRAWQTFEGGFDTEVQGLFTVAPIMDRYSMLLVTWYRNLSVWQDSREPDPQAQQLFRQRQALLDSAKPIATRLDIGN